MRQSFSAMEDTINFIASGGVSDLSNLLDNENSIECKISLANIQNDEPDDPQS